MDILSLELFGPVSRVNFERLEWSNDGATERCRRPEIARSLVVAALTDSFH